MKWASSSRKVRLLTSRAPPLPPTIPIFRRRAAPGLEKVLEAVHTTDCKIAPQLWHVGMARPFKGENLPNPELPPIGPSGIDVNTLQQTTDPMSAAKIEEVIDAFARAAADAKRLGFDGVEIHGAHGYLIDQFFWKETNKRTDEYGGDLVGRTRFASRIIHAVRKAVGSQFPIIFRFSQWKTGHYDAKLARTPVELEDFLTPLTEAGVDIFDCSTRRFWEPEFEGSRLNLAGWTKKLTGKPAISVGSVGLNREFTNVFDGGPEAEAASIDPLVERMQAGEFDLIAVGAPCWRMRSGRRKSTIHGKRKSASSQRRPSSP